MKKNYLFGMLALAAMTMVGCSNDEVVNDYSQDNAIQFGTYVGRDAQGRASVIDQTALEAQGFGVFAFYRMGGAAVTATTPDFMNNEKVWKAQGATPLLPNGWTYAPVKYWPNNEADKIDFYAYAPYEEGKSWNETSVNIEIKGDATSQIDYLYADPVKDKTKQKVDEQVKFVFHHALSRIGFKVEAVIDDVNKQEDGAFEDEDKENTDFYDGSTKVTVQEVEIFAPFAKGGTLSLETGVITPSSDDYVSFALTEANDDFIANVNDKGVSITKQQLNKDSKYLMLVPEPLTNVKVRVKYTVTTYDNKLPNGKSEIVNDITSESFNFEFVKGHAYDFVLHLGLTSVKLSAEITEGWSEHDVVVNVPINE